jgi:hypothetical protein
MQGKRYTVVIHWRHSVCNLGAGLHQAQAQMLMIVERRAETDLTTS